MHLPILAVLLSVSAVICHKTLTHDAVDAELNIIEDNVRGAEIVGKFLDNVRANQKIKVEAGKNMRTARAKEHSKHSTAASGDALRFGDLVQHGYLVNRTRPFADCTGPVSFTQGSRLWCESMGDYFSYGQACSRETSSGKFTVAYFGFNSPDCTGPASYSFSEHQEEKCTLNVGAIKEGNGFQMAAMQCSPETNFAAYKQPGLMFASHRDSHCRDDPSFFYNIRFNACTVIDMDDSYAYMKFTRCVQGGKVEAIIYTDASCQRPIFRTAVQMSATSKECEFQGYEYMSSECIN